MSDRTTLQGDEGEPKATLHFGQARLAHKIQDVGIVIEQYTVGIRLYRAGGHLMVRRNLLGARIPIAIHVSRNATAVGVSDHTATQIGGAGIDMCIGERIAIRGVERTCCLQKRHGRIVGGMTVGVKYVGVDLKIADPLTIQRT